MSFGVFQFKRGITTEWSSANPVLLSGEVGLETDTHKFKVGDGTTAWNSLPYGGIQGFQGPQGAQGLQGPQGPPSAMEIMYNLGTGATLTAGNIYYLNSSSVWTPCNASGTTASIGLVGIALGTTASAGILLRGLITGTTAPYTSMTMGSVQYMSTTDGLFSQTAPSGSGQVVRVLGYCTNASTDEFYFSPDNTWLKLT